MLLGEFENTGFEQIKQEQREIPPFGRAVFQENGMCLTAALRNTATQCNISQRTVVAAVPLGEPSRGGEEGRHTVLACHAATTAHLQFLTIKH